MRWKNDLIKIWNAGKGDFFLKNQLARILHWAQRDSLSLGIRNARDSGADHPPSPVIKLGLRHPRKKERNIKHCAGVERG